MDTVAAKIDIIVHAQEAGVPVISSMGAGNKLDPARFEVADIFKTEMDPLAKVMRRELKKRGVKSLKVVYSREQPVQTAQMLSDDPLPDHASDFDHNGPVHATKTRRSTPGSIAFVPSVAGLIIAGEVIRDLTGR